MTEVIFSCGDREFSADPDPDVGFGVEFLRWVNETKKVTEKPKLKFTARIGERSLPVSLVGNTADQLGEARAVVYRLLHRAEAISWGDTCPPNDSVQLS